MMTDSPFTTVVPQEEKKRDASEFIPWMRCAEANTPRGMRPGKLLIIRPLEQIADFRPLPADRDPNAWRGKLTIADIACLDPIEPAQDEYGMPLPGFEAGHQFRNQVVFPGYLNGAFRDYVGKTVIGVTYLGPNTKGKPPIMWRDMSKDIPTVKRGEKFLAAFPEFLIPVKAQFTDTQPAPTQNQGYGQDPWAQGAQSTSAPPQQTQAALNTLQQMEQWRAQQAAQSSDVPF